MPIPTSGGRRCVSTIARTGHGARVLGPRQDLAVAFVEDPAAELDTTFAAALAPRFVLPDGTLSGG
jgi:hypothetical protein